MITAPEYSLEIQTKIITTLCVLHNFSCAYNPEDIVGLEELSAQAPRQNAEDFSY
jgi:hypothetical protein